MSAVDRDEQIQIEIATLRAALKEIASDSDCSYMDEKERPDPCDCPACTAKRALKGYAGHWRFVGNHPNRIPHNPRERLLVEEWRSYMTEYGPEADDKFRQIVGLAPTPRDWFVATTIIQWLATNVGSSLITQAAAALRREQEEGKDR